jgi:hypothetical protein
MRTDTRTLEEKIAGCDAKRVVSTIEQQPSRPCVKPAAYGANKPRRSQLRRSRSVAPCDPTAGRATTGHDWPVRPGTRSVPGSQVPVVRSALSLQGGGCGEG